MNDLPAEYVRAWFFTAIFCVLGFAPQQNACGVDNPFLPSGAEERGWPTVRGPDLTGVSDEIRLASSWPKDGPPVLWVKEMGQGYSSFVAKNDHVYTQYQSVSGQYVVCLNADTGKTIWQHKYGIPFENAGMYPGPRSTPTLHGDRIYFATPSGEVGCLSQNGDLIWQKPLKATYSGKGTDFGYACSPIIHDAKVLMPIGGIGASMVALDAADGALIWKSGDDPASYSPAFPIRVGQQWQVIAYMQNSIAAYDLKTGEQLWRKRLSAGYDEHSAWPIYREPFLWTTAPFQSGCQVLNLMPEGDAAVEEVLLADSMSNDVSSSVLFGGHIYGFDLREAQSKVRRPSRGSFRCIDFASCEPVWTNGAEKSRRDVDDLMTVGHCSLIIADNKLIMLNDTGDLILAEATPDAYQQLARARVLPGEIVWPAPALHRGRLYVRNHQRAVCVYLGEPELLKRDSANGAISVADIPDGSVRNLATWLGVKPEYASSPPTRRWLWSWFGYSLALFAVSFIAASLVQMFGRQPQQSKLWMLYWGILFVLAAVTGPIASTFSGDFVFTWPVMLFVALEAAIYNVDLARRQRVPGRPTDYSSIIAVIVFVATGLGYFLICRQLGLVTQWAFLLGFAPAIPFTVLGRILTDRNGYPQLGWACSVPAFTAYFGCCVGILTWAYEIEPF